MGVIHTMRQKSWLSMMVIAVLAMVVAGCGGNSGSASGGAGNTANTANSPAANGGASASPEAGTAAPSASPAAEASVPAASGPVTVEHVKGTETFESTPQRVVVLEWSLAESVLALGIQPVGVADMEGYNNWVKAGADFAPEVVDVGTRQEPNLEAIMAIKPDLILAVDFRSENNYEQLKAIAPTVVFGSELEENVKSPYTYMVNTFQTIAQILGKEKEGQEVLDHMNQSFEAAKQKLKDAGKEGAPFVVTQAWSDQNAAVMRLFTDNSMAVEVLEQVGLTNAFEPASFQPNGFETISVEGLAQVQDANFFYVAQDDDNVFENQLKDNAVWKSLNFVKENRTYPLGGDMWMFGGPQSAELLVNKAVELLTK